MADLLALTHITNWMQLFQACFRDRVHDYCASDHEAASRLTDCIAEHYLCVTDKFLHGYSSHTPRRGNGFASRCGDWKVELVGSGKPSSVSGKIFPNSLESPP